MIRSSPKWPRWWLLACALCLSVDSAGAQDPDLDPPGVEISTVVPTSTIEALIRIIGTANDGESGVQAVEVASSRFGLPLTAELDDGGNFHVDVPLDIGLNDLNVTALDVAGNRSAPRPYQVTRELTAVPDLVIDSPVVSDGRFETTEATISVAGRILSTLAPDAFSVRLGALRAIATPDAIGYDFEFAAVALQLGNNRLEVVVESAYGPIRSAIFVERLDPNQVTEGAPPPAIELDRASDEITVQAAEFRLSGRVRTACLQSLRVDGLAPSRTVDDGGTTVSFHHDLALAEGPAITVTVEATSCDGQIARRSLRVRRDATAPTIVITEPVATGPGVIAIVDNPTIVRGYIDEFELGGASIQARALPLEPAVEADRWEFETSVHLDRGRETKVEIAAWDRGGSKTTRELTLRLDQDVQLDLWSPRSGDALIFPLGPAELDVSLHVRDAGASDTVWVQLDDGIEQLIGTGSGPYASRFDLVVDAGSDDHRITATVRAPDTRPLARTSASFTVQDEASVPAALLRQEPPVGSEDNEATTGLRLYFNRPLNPTDVEIQVYETFHGLVYRSPDVNTDIRNQSLVERITVDHTREPVPGRSQNLPGNRSFSFSPHNGWTYGATIEVDVLVEGNRVASTRFKIREFPTLLHAFLRDDNFDPLRDLRVIIPDQGHEARSDADGTFGFGWGWTVDRQLAAGLTRVAVNPGGENPRYGMIEAWFDVSGHQINGGRTLVVPSIPTSTRFSELRSGDSRAVLDQGRLVLDLSDATLDFGEGRDAGAVGPRMTDPHASGYGAFALHNPLFAVRLEPGGVYVRGEVGLEMLLPMRGGSHEYLDFIPSIDGRNPLGIVFGLDPAQLLLRPVGVVELDLSRKRLTTPRKLPDLQRLDVIAIGAIPLANVPTATAYIDNEIEFETLLAEIIDQATAEPSE